MFPTHITVPRQSEVIPPWIDPALVPLEMEATMFEATVKAIIWLWGRKRRRWPAMVIMGYLILPSTSADAQYYGDGPPMWRQCWSPQCRMMYGGPPEPYPHFYCNPDSHWYISACRGDGDLYRYHTTGHCMMRPWDAGC